MGKTVSFDVNKYLKIVEDYVKALPKDQLYAHIAICAGLVFILVAIITW